MFRAVAFRTRPYPGETRNGDAAVVVQRESSSLVAVVDALGHGPRAADSADRVAAELRAADHDGGLVVLFERIHAKLRGERGVALTAVLLRDGELEVCGVGNVALCSSGITWGFAPSPGILGVRVRKLRSVRAHARLGARLALASDGVSSRLHLEHGDGVTAEETCERLFALHAKAHDDATLLVVDV